MNFHKAKILLEKINRLYAGMSLDSDNISPIERDLMMNYIREFYEVFYMDKQGTRPVPTPPVVKKSPVEPIVKTTPVTPPPQPEIKVQAPPVAPPPKPEPIARVQKPIVPRPEPVVVKPEPITPPPPQPEVKVQAPPVVEKPEPPKPQEPPKREIKKFNFIPPPPRKPANPTPPPVAKPINTGSVSESDLFDTKSSNDLSSRLGLSKIDDLKRAFGLNDKMMYTNELFGGNNNVFKETMDQLNSFVTFNQAKDYLMKNIANKYNWTAKTKSKLAKDFIKTISRKYI